MSQKQEQYTKIITDEDNKKWFASLTDQEQYDLKLNTYRSFRNQKLQKTDVFMGQIDRYSQEQIDQLKTYRQLLRDMINQEPIVFPEEPDFIRKVEEKQVRPKF
jgi:hypothetical protein